MKLQPAELVQWNDNGWKRGRVMRAGENLITDDGIYTSGEMLPHDDVLVRHSITGELEFVPWGNLEIQGEVHPDG